MKITESIMLLLFVMALGSCNPRVDLAYYPSDEEEKMVEVAFNGYFGDFTPNYLKAYPTEEVAIMKHRITFDGIRVVFYSPSESDPSKPDKVVYVFDKDVKAKAGAFSGVDFAPSVAQGSGAINFGVKGSMKIKADDYIVYCFTSANDELKQATSVGKPFSEIQKTMSYDENDVIQNMLKVNHYFTPDPIMISKSQFADNSVAKIYPLPIARLTAINALLSVVWEMTVKDERYDILSDELLFTPDVQNRKYLLFPEMDEHLKTNYQLDYPIDANYTGFANKSIDELKNDFIYESTRPNMIIHSSGIGGSRLNNYRAVPENTVASTETSAKVVTRLIVFVRMIPKSLKAKLTPVQLKDPDLGWVNYKGLIYEAKDFLQLYKKAAEAQKPTPEQEELKTIGQRIMASSTSGKEVALIYEGYQDEDIQFYWRSFCYYALPITHAKIDTVGGTTNNGGYFGVVRNHHYEFKIKSFASLGKANPEDLGYDVDYLSDRYVTNSYDVIDMKKVVNEIDVLY